MALYVRVLTFRMHRNSCILYTYSVPQDSSLTDIDRHDDTATSETEENVPQRQHQEQQLVLMQTALDAKSNELEDLTVTKIHLEDKLASVEDEMREREEDRSLQVSSQYEVCFLYANINHTVKVSNT